ncbi:DUF5916 domain-containing protein [Portibacter lacus]|uniref:Hydrolase n=1 Tax=Portibacter lacus TaxID=1099794 RepID=A0AA37WHZ8_9BACT|nr:DUF5916 domain-containing protein [Portibacter lacus]GLR19110.1 hypothetical protein GCM10007940_37260 [Portibacter lacus]
MPKLFSVLLILLPIFLFANEIPHRVLLADRTNIDIKIDGSLDEEAWTKANIADKFTTLNPKPGLPANFETQVRILYNDNSLYIGALLIDPEPDQIMRQLCERDGSTNASSFEIMIDAYQSGINGFGFKVSAAGVQRDYLLTPEGSDSNWDAVWNSSVKITEFGWVVEMEIPYSALRFPKADVQKWGINFSREVRRTRETSYWNEIDPTIEGILTQAGVLEGIQNIKTPVRLMVTPYLSFGGSTNLKQEGSLSTGISGGMDLKYGINDAFTLDMTLIPDFSQVKFDEQVLNLTPFEVQFDENRAFFTEGTELFQKANLFYSRRIGGAPHNSKRIFDKEKEGNRITRYNNITQLLNATKISGRLQSGLGIGVFNAVVSESTADYVTQNGETQSVQVNPLTNYNVLVADQNLKNNSFISLINTNVLRFGDDYDANVTGTEFDFRTKNQKYSFAGSSALSQKYYSEYTDLGYTYSLTAGKIRGRYNYELSYKEESPNYDINDFGFLLSPNERTVSLRGSYNNYNARPKNIDTYKLTLSSLYSRLVAPNVFTDFSVTLNTFLRTSDFTGAGATLRLEPVVTYDYFEPRTRDYSQYYAFPTNWYFNSFVSTNYNKPIALDANINVRSWNEENRNLVSFEIEPRWRVNNKISLDWSYGWSLNKNDVGFVANSYDVPGVENPVIFGKRDRKTVVNQFTTKILFNENMYINLIGRHYWSKVHYNSYHLLGSKGELIETSIDDIADDGRKKYDVNFNLLNMDLVYSWRFAPGSDLIFVVKNFANNGAEIRNLRPSYSKSVQSVYEYNNNFSMNIKVLYFIDYFKTAQKFNS